MKCLVESLLHRESLSSLSSLYLLHHSFSCYSISEPFIPPPLRHTAFHSVRRAVMSTTLDSVVPRCKVIDSHLHVWAPADQTQQFPYFPGNEPTIVGSVEVLLQALEESGVDGALIVQPINHKFDHSYVSSVLQRYPKKFVGCCLADPTEGGGGVSELERLVNEEGYGAVRFNPYLWPAGQKMTNAVGKAMFAKAGQLGIPVGIVCLKGLLLQITDIEELCSEFSETAVIIDHFGMCKPPVNDLERDAWNKLLQLSRFPQVHIKVSAFFRISREQFPFKDTWDLVRQLIDAYGARRLLWGSDFPYVVDACGYLNAKNVIPAILEEGSLSEEDMAWILGRTASELFKGSWE